MMFAFSPFRFLFFVCARNYCMRLLKLCGPRGQKKCDCFSLEEHRNLIDGARSAKYLPPAARPGLCQQQARAWGLGRVAAGTTRCSLYAWTRAVGLSCPSPFILSSFRPPDRHLCRRNFHRFTVRETRIHNPDPEWRRSLAVLRRAQKGTRSLEIPFKHPSTDNPTTQKWRRPKRP